MGGKWICNVLEKYRRNEMTKKGEDQQKSKKERKRRDRRTSFGFILVMPSMSCSPTSQRGKTSETE